MADDYKNNHYVPIWYQDRFVPNAQQDRELYYLDLHPGSFKDPRGVMHAKRGLWRQGFRNCFAQDDLYTTTLGDIESRDVEKYFFGDIDRNGRNAIDFFANFDHTTIDHDSFRNMILYMSTQKLRTPKGLDWLSKQVGSADRNVTLAYLIRLQQIYCATWMECIWQIADASESETKFIVSDHPVTVYNRKCGPRSPEYCRGSNDPDIRMHGTHTIFPLSMEKVLILTNLSWVRNPYQSETKFRPNPKYFRGTVFKFTEIQIQRHLSEQEVREINFIMKSRALNYIAAAEKEWLYPEMYVSKSDWYNYGNGYLLMPDPRGVQFSSELVMGYTNDTAEWFDAYGRRPWQPGYNDESEREKEFRMQERFKGEFASLFGPYRRGRAFDFGRLDNERDSDELHAHHLRLWNEPK